jgi:hypothetical protein
MPSSAEEIRAAVEQRFAQVARSPDQEQMFPVSIQAQTPVVMLLLLLKEARP